MYYACCAGLGYLLGSVSPSYILSKVKKVDLRQSGTKNLGASNTFVHFGRFWGVFVMFFDIFKAFVAVKLCQWLFSKFIQIVKNIDVSTTDLGQIFLLRDGTLASLCYGEMNMYFVTIDLEAGTISEKIEVPYNGYNFAHYAGTYCDFLLVDSNGVFTYNMGDESH